MELLVKRTGRWRVVRLWTIDRSTFNIEWRWYVIRPHEAFSSPDRTRVYESWSRAVREAHRLAAGAAVRAKINRKHHQGLWVEHL